ncbi:MAG: helix-turn-helix transcriptional regulator [Bacilli bacterium]
MKYLKKIKDLREDHDLTQEELSKVLHISQRAYSYYETGDRDIPIDIVCELADYYGVSVDYLLDRSDKNNNQ